VALAFSNELEYHNDDGHIDTSYDWSTSSRNFESIDPVTLDITTLETNW